MIRTENHQRELLEQLKRKADQATTAHAWLRDRYQLINSIVTTISLTAGVFLLAIVMASTSVLESTFGLTQVQIQWMTALMAAGSFSIVVILLAWRPDVKATNHDQAVRHYTKASYEATRLLRRDVVPTEEEVENIQNEYLDNRDLPRIPESKFLYLKQWHLQKVQMSKALDRNPYEELRSMKRRSNVGEAGDREHKNGSENKKN